MPLKPKTVEINGATYVPVGPGGLPLAVHDDGKEVEFDIAAAVDKIKTVSGARDAALRTLGELETKAKAFDGLDAEAARAALETVRNLDSKKLLDAGKVDDIIKERTKEAADNLRAREQAWATEREALNSKVSAAEAATRKHLISTRFASSKTLGKTVLPPDVAERYWGENFKVEGNEVVGYRADGTKIFGRTTGDTADFEEALDILIDSYPNKESILKGSQSTGSGATGNTRDSTNGHTPRSKMSAEQRTAFINTHGSEAYLQLPA